MISIYDTEEIYVEIFFYDIYLWYQRDLDIFFYDIYL